MENAARAEALCLEFSIKAQAVLSILCARKDVQESNERKDQAHAEVTSTHGTSRRQGAENVQLIKGLPVMN